MLGRYSVAFYRIILVTDTLELAHSDVSVFNCIACPSFSRSKMPVDAGSANEQDNELIFGMASALRVLI